jgi:dTMP kinase
MKFIVIEGLDGSGKSTQISKLQNLFKQEGIPLKYLHFPRTNSPFYGEMVARFLRGELGEIDVVNPYIVALLYAGDRNDAKKQIQQWLAKGKTVLVDRYVLSNIAFQGAKLENETDRQKLIKWITELEYSYHKIPKPDLSIFLNVPFSFTQNKLTNNRAGDDRDYLKGQQDIHEKDLNFQKAVRNVYLNQVNADPGFVKIDCFDDNEDMLTPDEIFQKITDCLKSKGMV